MVWATLFWAKAMRAWWSLFKGRPGEPVEGVLRRRKWLVAATVSCPPVLLALVMPVAALRWVGVLPTVACVAVLVLSVVRVRRLSSLSAGTGQGQPMSTSYVQPAMSRGQRHPVSDVHGPSRTQGEAVWGSAYTPNALAKETTDVLIEWLWYSDASRMSPREAVAVAARMQPRTRARFLLIAEQITASDLNEEALMWWMSVCTYLRDQVGYGVSGGPAPSAFLADRIEGDAA
jgi:hypothetical protein